MRRLSTFILLTTALCGQKAPLALPLRQITELQGAMSNQLTGFGLVTGLNSTGSGSKVTRQALLNFIRRHGINPELADLTTGATALVAVSAELPAFSKVGMKLDVDVTSLGDESDLRGGRLLPVKLMAWDGKVYATAAGPVFVNGFKASSTDKNVSITSNHVTGGTISNGAQVVVAPKSFFLSEEGHLELRFRNPSVSTAIEAAEAINKLLEGQVYKAIPIDGYMVQVQFPENLRTAENAMRLLNRIGDVLVPIRVNEKVILNETSGLIIAGENVQISPCVLALSNLTITVVSQDEVVQPIAPFTKGQTEVVGRTHIDVQRDNSQVTALKGGATVGDLVANLKALALNPQELIEVFKHLKAIGYLHAELITR
jgi:flagellar P-ring protein FlgI